MRSRTLALLLALAGCASPQPPVPTLGAGPVCRLGPDGGIPVADRGIGGTGITPESGIGGTGQVADRGIGGTGIIGVITGFASVCVGGQEIAYPPGLPVLVDGEPATLAALRAGQVTTITAGGRDGLLATSLAVRHEVSGPVERTEPDGAVRVAGQRVVPAPGAWGAVPQAGQWVMVSGFHQADGTVSATRIDPRSPGDVLVRGVMQRDRGRLRIGTLEVRAAPGQFTQSGVPVLAVGRLLNGVLLADTVEPDAVLIDPVGFFGPAVGVLIIEGYAEGGRFRAGRFDVPAPAGRAIARFERRGEGFVPAGVRESGPAGFAPGFGPAGPRTGGFQPAPIPDRRLDRAQGGGRAGGPGNRGGYGGMRRGREDGGLQGGGAGDGPPGEAGGRGGFDGPRARGR